MSNLKIVGDLNVSAFTALTLPLIREGVEEYSGNKFLPKKSNIKTKSRGIAITIGHSNIRLPNLQAARIAVRLLDDFERLVKNRKIKPGSIEIRTNMSDYARRHDLALVADVEQKSIDDVRDFLLGLLIKYEVGSESN